MGSELLDFKFFELKSHLTPATQCCDLDTPPYYTPLPSYTLHPNLWPPVNVSTLPCSWPVAVLVWAPAADVAFEEPKSRQPHPLHSYIYQY